MKYNPKIFLRTFEQMFVPESKHQCCVVSKSERHIVLELLQVRPRPHLALYFPTRISVLQLGRLGVLAKV